MPQAFEPCLNRHVHCVPPSNCPGCECDCISDTSCGSWGYDCQNPDSACYEGIVLHTGYSNIVQRVQKWTLQLQLNVMWLVRTASLRFRSNSRDQFGSKVGRPVDFVVLFGVWSWIHIFMFFPTMIRAPAGLATGDDFYDSNDDVYSGERSYWKDWRDSLRYLPLSWDIVRDAPITSLGCSCFPRCLDTF